MNFWQYLAERQRQKTIRKALERETRRLEDIIKSNPPNVALQLIEATGDTIERYLDRALKPNQNENRIPQ